MTFPAKSISHRFFAFCTVLAICCLFSCGHKIDPRRAVKADTGKPKLFLLVSPQNGETLKSNDSLKITVQALVDSLKPDSCVLAIDGQRRYSFSDSSRKIPLSSVKMGVRRISLAIHANDTVAETLLFAIKVIPSSPPRLYKYKVLNEYPHDDNAYTQGLFFSDGHLYEGTGREGYSSLRKIELETGRIVRQLSLDDKYFGEGVCLHKGDIYQLTWRNREGFVYNFSDFTLKGRFDYSSEGWGIASDGERLRMSDGTPNLYTLNDNLNVMSQIEVYDDRGPQGNLNELEYINGEIWANVYTSDYIVTVNPDTGEVTGRINLAGLLKKEYRKPHTDVLNGIAYDKEKRRIFVTGKNWPKLFEIELIAD
ncbi:MAG: glutaminyl-peptide cyclotransferase [Prevotellaceae bacterium]|jgi:glutamine cyclotransferase|nr:glutaminyl-peptide cyclotransferase [Prevotellaceae bacterium]